MKESIDQVDFNGTIYKNPIFIKFVNAYEPYIEIPTAYPQKGTYKAKDGIHKIRMVPPTSQSSGGILVYKKGLVKSYNNPDKPGWVLDGIDDLPARVFTSGNTSYMKDGSLHNMDGPARIYADGTKYFCIDGVGYTEAEYQARIKIINIAGKVAANILDI